MASFPWAELIPVVGGTLVLSAFAASVVNVWRHRRPGGASRASVPVGARPAPPGLQLEETDAAWGWIRRDGAQWVVFVDPYDRSDGELRIGTPLPYRARVDLEGGRMTLHAPLLPFVALLVVVFPLSLGLLWVNHTLLAGRIERRLAAASASTT